MNINNKSTRESLLSYRVDPERICLLGILGSGGSSDVYIAKVHDQSDEFESWGLADISNSTQVAVKVFKLSKHYTHEYINQLITRELQVSQLGYHPNLLQVLGYSDDRVVYDLCLVPTLGDIVIHTGAMGEL